MRLNALHRVAVRTKAGMPLSVKPSPRSDPWRESRYHRQFDVRRSGRTEAGQAGQHQARLGGPAANCASLEFGEAPVGSPETAGALTALLRRERPHGIRGERKNPVAGLGTAPHTGGIYTSKSPAKPPYVASAEGCFHPPARSVTACGTSGSTFSRRQSAGTGPRPSRQARGRWDSRRPAPGPDSTVGSRGSSDTARLRLFPSHR
jgi:hypothetical protein